MADSSKLVVSTTTSFLTLRPTMATTIHIDAMGSLLSIAASKSMTA